jgi:hypothetical protein
MLTFLFINVGTNYGTSDSNTENHGVVIRSTIFKKSTVFGVTLQSANTEH